MPGGERSLSRCRCRDGVFGPAGLSTTASVPTVAAGAWLGSAFGATDSLRCSQTRLTLCGNGVEGGNAAGTEKIDPTQVEDEARCQGRRMIFTAPSCFFWKMS